MRCYRLCSLRKLSTGLFVSMQYRYQQNNTIKYYSGYTKQPLFTRNVYQSKFNTKLICIVSAYSIVFLGLIYVLNKNEEIQESFIINDSLIECLLIESDIYQKQVQYLADKLAMLTNDFIDVFIRMFMNALTVLCCMILISHAIFIPYDRIVFIFAVYCGVHYCALEAQTECDALKFKINTITDEYINKWPDSQGMFKDMDYLYDDITKVFNEKKRL
jgi:hypothetical protein